MITHAAGLAIVGAVSLGLAACAGATGGHGPVGTAEAPVATRRSAAMDAGGVAAGSSPRVGGGSGDAGAAGSAEFIAPSGPQAAQAAQRYGEGAAAYGRGDFAAAARSFQQAYDLFPAPAMAYNLARVYERMGEVEPATRYFQIVQRANPPPSADQMADIDRRIAGLRAYDQRRREGIAQALPTTDALSQEGNTWFQNGVRFYRRHAYRQALMAFEQAYNYLQTPELFYNLAVTHRALHNVDRALEFMREYLAARRGTPEEAWIEQQVRALEALR